MGIFKTEEEKNFDELKNLVNQSRLPDNCKTYLKEYIENVKTKKEKNPFLEFPSFETMILNIATSYYESKDEIQRSINNINKAMEIIRNTNTEELYLNQIEYVLNNYSGKNNNLDFDDYLYSMIGSDKYWRALNIARTNNLTNEAMQDLKLLIDEISLMVGDTELLGNYAINYLNKYNNILEGKEEYRKKLIKQVKQANGIYDFNQKDIELVINLVDEIKAENDELKNNIEVSKKLKSNIAKALIDVKDFLSKLNNTISNGEKIIDDKIELAKQALESSEGRIEQDIKTRAEEYIKTVIKIVVENAVTELQNNKKSVLTPEVIETVKVIKENQTYIVDNIANHVLSDKMPTQTQESTPVVVSGAPQTTIIQQSENNYFIEPNKEDFNPPIYVNGLIENLRKEKERIKIIQDKIEKLKSEGQYVHSAVEEVAIELVNGYKIPYLWGPTKSGKSYITSQVLKVLYGDRKFIHVVPIMDSEAIGSYLSIGGHFVPNNTYIAIKYGHPLVLEEIDNWDPTAVKEIIKKYISPAYGVINAPENTINITFANLLTVRPNPNFRAILTSNTSGDGMKNGYICSNPLDPSVLSSIVKIYVDYDNELEKSILYKYPTWFNFTQEMRKNMEDYISRNPSAKEKLEGYLFTTEDADIISDVLNERKEKDGSLYRIVKNYILKGNNNDKYLKAQLEWYEDNYLKGYTKTKESIDEKNINKITIEDIAYLYTKAADEQIKILQKR